MYKNKFIGPEQITGEVLCKRKTYLGNPVYELSFKNGIKKEYPKEILDKIITKEAIAWDDLRANNLGYVVEKILAILTESEVSYEEAKYILQSMAPMSLETNKKKADECLWGKKDYQITMADIEEQLKKDAKNNKS